MLTATSSIPPVVLAFCEWNLPEDTRVLAGCSSRIRYHRNSTESDLAPTCFTFLVQIKERVFVPSTPFYLPSLTFGII